MTDETPENAEAYKGMIETVRGERTGRTAEETLTRMGDHFEYMGAEQNPNQMQLDDLSNND